MLGTLCLSHAIPLPVGKQVGVPNNTNSLTATALAAAEGPGAWPRGFPLRLIRKPCKHSLQSANHSSMAKIAVVQSLAQHEPDVDGIFRMTRTTPFNFDTASKRTLVIPHGTLTPYNAQATLVLQPALWSLLLPVTVGLKRASIT